MEYLAVHLGWRALILKAGMRLEQRRREDAKPRAGQRQFLGRLAFALQMKPSDLGARAGFALFPAFASSRLRCSTAALRLMLTAPVAARTGAATGTFAAGGTFSNLTWLVSACGNGNEVSWCRCQRCL